MACYYEPQASSRAHFLCIGRGVSCCLLDSNTITFTKAFSLNTIDYVNAKRMLTLDQVFLIFQEKNHTHVFVRLISRQVN